jgi:hypothetical protein
MISAYYLARIVMTVQCPNHEKIYLFGRGGSDAEHQKHQTDIGTLLDNHQVIQRQVTLLGNGFTATTTSNDPEVVRTLQTHVSDMKARFAKGRGIRSWDKVYAILFAYREQIQVNYQMLKNGVTSIVTSENPELIEVLHAHAHAVSGFVAQGRQGSGESYPISEALEKLLDNAHNTK